jgi:hypothetical protein
MNPISKHRLLIEIYTFWINLSTEEFRKKSMDLSVKVRKTFSPIFWKGPLTFWL